MLKELNYIIAYVKYIIAYIIRAKSKKEYYIFKFCILTLALMLFISMQASAAVITSSNKIVKQGQTFDLNISIDPEGTPIAGVQLNLAFNKSILKINKISEGNLFNKNGSTFFNSGVFNNLTGTAANIFNVVIESKSVTTPGTFIIINMTANGISGTSGISLSGVKISGPSGVVVPFSIISGNVTIVQSDTAPPVGINSLRNTTYEPGYIRWAWKDPADADFARVIVYVNSSFMTNVTKGVMFYNATSLIPNTAYTISTHTVDTYGNINKTWLNHTARTAPSIIRKASVNLIKNNGFESGTTSWQLYTNGAGSFTAITSGYEGNNSAKVVVSSSGTNIQLYQIGVTLEPNTQYRLSFAAYSNTGHDVTVRLFKHVSPYTAYMPDFTANLSTSWKEFTTEFTTTGFAGTVNDGRLMFWLAPFAKAGDVYYIDNVILEKSEIFSLKY